MGKEKKKIPLINPLIRNKEINKEKKERRPFSSWSFMMAVG